MAFFRKAADIFALDIGSSSVKALQLREAGGSYRLTALGTASLPPEAIADGSIKDAPTVIEAIRSSVSKSGIKAKETAIAISGRELIIKKVQIPEVPPRDVHPVVQLEAEHHIPFAIDEVFLDYHTVGQHGGVMDLILVAAKLGRDVGVRWEAVVPALEAVSRELSLEVQRTFDYFASTAESERIGRIVLAGGCSLLPGLNDYLASNWGIPVELARPFARVEVDPAYGEEVNAAGPALAIAEGQRELAQLKVTIGQVNQIKAQAEELRKRLSVLEELMKGQGRPIALVDTFASVIPKDLWITGFETREDFRLKVSGSAFSTTAVSDFMQNLRSSGKFQEVDIVISRRDLSKPAGLVTFEVTCRFHGCNAASRDLRPHRH